MFRYFEVNTEQPYVHYLNMYQSQHGQRGLGYMPKRGCNSDKNEIARYTITIYSTLSILFLYLISMA